MKRKIILNKDLSHYYLSNSRSGVILPWEHDLIWRISVGYLVSSQISVDFGVFRDFVKSQTIFPDEVDGSKIYNHMTNPYLASKFSGSMELILTLNTSEIRRAEEVCKYIRGELRFEYFKIFNKRTTRACHMTDWVN